VRPWFPGGQRRDDAIRFGRLCAFPARVRSAVRNDLLAVEGDGLVERQHDDALEAGRQLPQPLDLLEQAAGRAGRRREQNFGPDCGDLRGDRLAGEEQIEWLHGGRTHRRPIGDRRRGAVGRQQRDDVARSDAIAPQPSRSRAE
jgi:hypothetical protein